MTKTKIGIVIPPDLRRQLFSPKAETRLGEIGDVTWAKGPALPTIDEACALLQGCVIGVGSWRTPFPNAALLARCPDLRLWVHAAGSVKGFFGPHLEGRDLTIASCAPAIADMVAEIVLGEIIVGLKRVPENGAANRRGKAQKPANSRSLSSSTVGVVGASQVGRRVIAHLRHFETTTLLYDPFVSEDEATTLGVHLLRDLNDLCARSDAVTLHTPLLPATRHLLGREQFAAMRDDAVFINCSRGGCVDETALIEALSQNRFFAFLDVTDPEPAYEDSPLRSLPNVVLTSHIAGGAQPGIGRQVVSDIEAWLAGHSPAMVVTEAMLDRIA
jgi:phosphoglycerate dehydrogenase-like enzyme